MPGSYRAWFGDLFAAFPDFELEIVEVVAEGDKAVVRWSAIGTFNGSTRFEGLDPNGARVEIQGCDVLTIRDGRIQRNDAYMNAADLARQLGALPPAGSPVERVMTAALNMKTHLADTIHQRSYAEALERLGDVDRTTQVVALGHVDAVLAQHLRRDVVLHVLGDRRLAEAAGDLHDRLNRKLVGIAVGHVADEGAVDLDQVEGDALQVVEGPEAGAVVVDRDLAAELGDAVGKAGGRFVVVDGRGLGDLEGAARWIGLTFVELPLDVFEHREVGDRGAREVDVERDRISVLLALGEQPQRLCQPPSGRAPAPCRSAQRPR